MSPTREAVELALASDLGWCVRLWTRAGWIVAVLVVLSACSADDEPVSTTPIFGTEDTTCESVTLRNEDNDEQLLTQAVDCLLGEIDAGRPVTVDISAATVEGDPIYNRFAFDGERILIVEDNRADGFGRPEVQAQWCSGIATGVWVPEGVDCEDADHPGFPEAVQ